MTDYRLLVEGHPLRVRQNWHEHAIENRQPLDVHREFANKQPPQWLGQVRPLVDGTWVALTANRQRLGQFKNHIVAAQQLDQHTSASSAP